MNNTIPQFQALIETEDPSIIVGTESWLPNSTYSSEFLPAHYQIFRKDKVTDTTGGCVFLAIITDLIAREEPDLHSDCESIWASIHVKGNPALYVGSFYRKHVNKTDADKSYISELESAISKIPNNSQILLAGDFNIPDVDWDKVCFKPGGRYPAVSKQIIDFTQDQNLHQTVFKPTRGDPILDLVFTNVPSLVQNVDVIPGVSDHDIVMVDFFMSSQKIKQPRRKIFLYKKGEFDKIDEHLVKYAKTVTDEVYNSSSVNELWLNFEQILSHAVDQHIPSKMVKPNTSLPWFKQSHKRGLRRKRIKGL